MSNSAVISKRSSFMIEDILRCTHDPQDDTLTHESSWTPKINKENYLHEESYASEVSSKPKATRVYPSTQQKKFLLDAFSIQPHPSRQEMTQIAECIGFKFDKVRRWFENRRNTEKRRHLKKLQELDNLASSLSSLKQPVNQVQPQRSSSYGNQTCTPVSTPYLKVTTCRNYGLVQRSYIRPMPLYRRAVQTSRVETVPEQMVPVYNLTHAPQNMTLTQRNVVPLVRSVYSRSIPVAHRFQV